MASSRTIAATSTPISPRRARRCTRFAKNSSANPSTATALEKRTQQHRAAAADQPHQRRSPSLRYSGRLRNQRNRHRHLRVRQCEVQCGQDIRPRIQHEVVRLMRFEAGLLTRDLYRAPETAQLVDQPARSEEHTSELQSLAYLVCRLLLEKKKKTKFYPSLQYNKQQARILYP